MIVLRSFDRCELDFGAVVHAENKREFKRCLGPLVQYCKAFNSAKIKQSQEPHSVRIASRSITFPILAGAIWVSSAVASTTQDFEVRSTSDLVSLCSAEPGSENYVAAIHFCQGFASGAFRYYQSMAEASPSSKFVCVPNPVPSRNDVIASYVEWVRANPQVMGEAATDSLFRFLGTKYPCKT
jgi:hypothetical protein